MLHPTRSLAHDRIQPRTIVTMNEVGGERNTPYSDPRRGIRQVFAPSQSADFGADSPSGGRLAWPDAGHPAHGTASTA